MSVRWLLTLFLFLPTLAYSQTRAPYRTANIALCIAPIDPPADSLRIYCDSPSWGSGNWSQWDLPGFFPKGGVRTGIWLGCPADSVLSFGVWRGGKEVSRSYAADNSLPENLKDCWNTLKPATKSLTMNDFMSPTDHIAQLQSDCLSDTNCGSLVMKTCLDTPACKDAITSKLTKVDFDQDGRPGTSFDAWWWKMTLEGQFR